MFAKLGEHTFQGLVSPASLDESSAARYARVPLVNGKDALQKTGTELEEISVTVRYASDFCTPQTEIDALKASMNAGEKLPFVTGEGEIKGKFVITGVDVTGERYSSSGVLEAATVSVSLLECEATEPAPKGTALASSKPAAQKPEAPATGPANNIASDVSKAKSKVAQMKSAVKSAKKGVTSFKRGVRDVKKLAGDAQQLYSTAKTKVENTKKIAERATHLPTSLNEAMGYAENLAKLDNTADMSVLEMNVGKMSESSDKVTAHAAPVVAFSASREGGT